MIRQTPKGAYARKRKARRKKDRFARQYHSKEFVEWTCAQPCAVAASNHAHKCSGIGVPAHGPKTRGAGGTWEDIVPWCDTAEDEFHAHGPISFALRHSLDLQAEADKHHQNWESRIE